MGIVGAVLVARWAKNLIAETGKVLLDREMDHPVVEEIREAVETGPGGGRTASPTYMSGGSASGLTYSICRTGRLLHEFLTRIDEKISKLENVPPYEHGIEERASIRKINSPLKSLSA